MATNPAAPAAFPCGPAMSMLRLPGGGDEPPDEYLDHPRPLLTVIEGTAGATAGPAALPRAVGDDYQCLHTPRGNVVRRALPGITEVHSVPEIPASYGVARVLATTIPLAMYLATRTNYSKAVQEAEMARLLYRLGR